MLYRTVENNISITDAAIEAAKNLKKSVADFWIQFYKSASAYESNSERLARVLSTRLTPWPTQKTLVVTNPSERLYPAVKYTNWVQSSDDMSSGRWVTEGEALTEAEKEWLGTRGATGTFMKGSWPGNGRAVQQITKLRPRPIGKLFWADDVDLMPTDDDRLRAFTNTVLGIPHENPQPQYLTPDVKTFLGMQVVTSEKMPPGNFAIINNNFDPEHHTVMMNFLGNISSVSSDLYQQAAKRMYDRIPKPINPYGCRAVNFKPKLPRVLWTYWENRQSEHIALFIPGVLCTFIRQKNPRIPQPWKLQRIKQKGMESPVSWLRVQQILNLYYPGVTHITDGKTP